MSSGVPRAATHRAMPPEVMRLITLVPELGPASRRAATRGGRHLPIVEGQALGRRSRSRSRDPCPPPPPRRPGRPGRRRARWPRPRSRSHHDLGPGGDPGQDLGDDGVGVLVARSCPTSTTATSAPAAADGPHERALARGHGPLRIRTRTGPGDRRPAAGRCREDLQPVGGVGVVDDDGERGVGVDHLEASRARARRGAGRPPPTSSGTPRATAVVAAARALATWNEPVRASSTRPAAPGERGAAGVALDVP